LVFNSPRLLAADLHAQACQILFSLGWPYS
jgi:hypothetical protein